MMIRFLCWLLLIISVLRFCENTKAEGVCFAPYQIDDQRTQQPILYVFTSQNHAGCRLFWLDYFHGPTVFRQTLDRHFRLVNALPRHLPKQYELPVFMDEHNNILISSYSSWQSLLKHLNIPLPLQSQQHQATPFSSTKPEKNPPDSKKESVAQSKAVPLIIPDKIPTTLFQFVAGKITALLPIGLGSAELLTASALGGPVGLAFYFGLRGILRFHRLAKSRKPARIISGCKNCEQLTALLDNERREWQRLNTNHESTIDDLTDRLNKSEQARVAGDTISTRVEYIRVPVMDKEGQLYREAMRREIDVLPQSSEIVMRIEKTFRELLRGQRIENRCDKTALTTEE